MIGEIECREGKYYFKDGDEVVAVFNDDKVCGVHVVERDDTEYIKCDCHNHLEPVAGRTMRCAVCGNSFNFEKALAYVPTVYPTGKEG